MVRGPSARLADPMARPLAALERFFERLVERPIGRLFRAPLEPGRVERRLGLAMDEGRRTVAGRTLAPDRYRVQLHAHDLASLLRADARLEARLAGGCRAGADRGSPRGRSGRTVGR